MSKSKKILFILLILAISIISIPLLINAQVEEKIINDIQKIDTVQNIEKSSDETVTLKVFNTTSIETGSKVTSAIIPVMVNGDISKQCVFELNDDILNKMAISEEFQCSGSYNVKLTEFGNYALEDSILYDRELKMIVKTTDSNEEIPSIVSNPVIEYKKPTYFAKVENGIVTKVIVADRNFVETKAESGYWVETLIDSNERGMFAGVGYTYDDVNGWFLSPKPYDSWILNTTNFTWESSVPYPKDGSNYYWDEKTLSWILVESIETPVEIGK